MEYKPELNKFGQLNDNLRDEVVLPSTYGKLHEYALNNSTVDEIDTQIKLQKLQEVQSDEDEKDIIILLIVIILILVILLTVAFKIPKRLKKKMCPGFGSWADLNIIKQWFKSADQEQQE